MTTLRLLLVWLIVPSVALARQPVPDEFWGADAKLTLAQVLVGEADWHRLDHEIIAYVLVKRWRTFRRNRSSEITFKAFAKRYSAPMKTGANSYRARHIRVLPWGPALSPHTRDASLKVYNERWKKVRRTAESWGRGEIKDPCPRAMHWGGKMDKPRYGWEIIQCGDTHNIFYRPGKG